MPDFTVHGDITGGTTSATIEATGTCLNGLPEGTISGTLTRFNGTETFHYTFDGNSALSVATIESLESASAYYIGVTVTNLTTGRTFPNSTASVTATRLTGDSWLGSFEITSPGGPQILVFGVFTGNVSVSRSVVCATPGI